MQGDIEAALSRGEEALATAREVGEAELIAHALTIWGDINLVRGQHDEARACLEEVREIVLQLGDRLGLAATTFNLAHVAIAEGNLSQAQRQFEQSILSPENSEHERERPLA
jgi:tetratricopeptide (TPR) repeat protein